MSKVLCLRVNAADMSSFWRPSFVWPSEGEVVAPDWDPKPVCGYGLHGLVWGQGDIGLFGSRANPKWIVFEAELEEGVNLGDKYKFPRGRVVHVSDEVSSAANYMYHHGGRECGRAIPFVTLTGGYRATLTGGYRATLTGGNGATLTGGNRATLTGGDWATLTGGDRATLTGGNGAVFICRHHTADKIVLTTAVVGQEDIKPGVAYRVTDGKFVAVKL